MVNSGLTMSGLAAMAIGALTLVVVFTIIPLVGSQIDQAVTLPSCPYTTNTTGCAVGSAWNASATAGAGLPTAVSLWGSMGGILKVAGVIGFNPCFSGCAS
jgi:hypothetical protein